jgi:hypothetical protein
MAYDQTDQMMEISWEYKQGLRNLEEAVDKMCCVTGLDPDVAEVFLRGLNRDNIVRVDFNEKTRNGREARRTVGPGPKLPKRGRD